METSNRSPSFLLLPGEIRNKIYDLVFQHHVFELQWNRPHNDLTYWVPGDSGAACLDSSIRSPRWQRRDPKLNPHLNPNASQRRRLFDLPCRQHSSIPNRPIYQLSPGPAALLLTCRQIHNETCSIFYGNNTFCFTSRTLLQKFLSSINVVSRASIQRLRLQHVTYGDPYRTSNCVWKELHDTGWDKACHQAAEELNSLKELSIRLRVCDVPLVLNLTASWVAPFLAFRGRGLTKVEIHLSALADNKRLRACAQILREELLGVEYREDEETRQRTPGPKKAKMCLRIC